MLIHLITSIESGGAQRVLYEYLKSSHNDQEQIVFYLRAEPFFEKRFNNFNINVYKLNSLKTIIIFLTALKKGTALKSWMYHGCVFSSIAKLINPRIRITWSIHHGNVVNDDGFSTKLFSKIAAYLSYLVPSSIIYPSEFCKNNHINIGFNKTKGIVIFNPIEHTEYIKPEIINTKKRYIGFCARNHPNKRYSLFLKSAIMFCEINNFVNFVICGSGTNNMETIKLIQQKNLESRFEFLGEVEDTSHFYRITDVYTSLSTTESFGLTLLEAYASGCTLVCSDLEIFYEILQNRPIYVKEPSTNSVISAWNIALSSPPVKVDLDYLQQFSIINFYKKYSNVIFKLS